MTPKYRADIDGLRAIAVLAVFLFHLSIPPFSGGYVGVDVFFVISGYLITTIILNEIEKGSFSISQFYAKRFKRILPALIVVMAFCSLIGSLLLNPDSYYDFGRSLAATALFISNLFFHSQSGYFEGPAELKPLLHTWSLAVEEQYYILFPLLLISIARTSSKNYKKWFLVVTGFSLLICIIGTKINSSAAFYLIPFRAWELFIGSLLAANALPKSSNRYLLESFSLIGLLLIGLSTVFFDSATDFPGMAALLPTLGTALVIYGGRGGLTTTSRILGLNPLVFIGLISYSLYLWHWPIIVFFKHYAIIELSKTQVSSIILITFILAFLTWKYIETPFRKANKPKKTTLLYSGSALSIVFTIGLTIFLNNGFEHRFSDSIKFISSENDHEWAHWGSCEEVNALIKNSNSLCHIGIASDQPGFIFWGDSHARALASAIDMSAKSMGTGGYIATKPKCPPLLALERENEADCHPFNQTILNYIEDNPHIHTVILAARWAISITGTRYKSEEGESIKLIDLLSSNNESKNNMVIFETGLYRTVEQLHKLGKQVVLIQQIPEVGYEVPNAHFISNITGRDVNRLIAPTVGEYKSRIANVDMVFSELEKNLNITLIDPSRYLCDKHLCKIAVEKNTLYRDDNHLSTFGSKYVSNSFNTLFSTLITKPTSSTPETR